IDFGQREPCPDMRHRLHDETPGIEAFRRSTSITLVLGSVEVRFQGGDNAFGDLVLHGEEFEELSVIPRGPHLQTGGCIAQLHRYAEALSRAPDAAREHIANPEISPDLLHVNGLAPVAE